MPDRIDPSDVERLLARDLDERSGGRLGERARLTSRSLESYLRAGMRPRWMERLMEIDNGIRRVTRELEAEHRALAERCTGDGEEFACRWRARVATLRFDALNALIRAHNQWYGIERDLPQDPRTGEFRLIQGRSFRREEIGADWVLERFPAG